LDRSDLTIAQMLGSRLCHDLITPVSAVSSGLELLEDHSGDNTQDIHDLISKSAKTAAKRLAFYRFAFGYGGVGGLKSISKVREVIEPYLDPQNINLRWDVFQDVLEEHDDLQTWAKLLCNLVLCAVESSPYGGELSVSQADSEDFNLSVTMRTPRLAFSENVHEIIEQGSTIENLTPQTIQAFLTWRLGNALGRHLIIDKSDDSLQISTTK